MLMLITKELEIPKLLLGSDDVMEDLIRITS